MKVFSSSSSGIIWWALSFCWTSTLAQRHQNQQQDEPRRLSSSGKASKGGKKETPPSMMMAVGVADQIQYPYDPWLPEEGDAAQRLTIPSISQPFYDNVIDVRATVSAKDTSLILSTAGNWQFALRKLLADKVFVENPEIQESYLITTTPPISVPQLNKGLVKVGNILFTDAQPHIVIGPPPLMNGLAKYGLYSGRLYPRAHLFQLRQCYSQIGGHDLY